ncbi:NUDIX hydrolase [Enterococcus sp. LJL128]|uniref:NUDIX hydrolase n=1 Tax=Enterococcus sp. LJL51 TaxID=3416656 RepID=UPI003CEE6EA6
MEKELTVLLSKLQGIAQTGKAYAQDPYDIERYDELQKITAEMIQLLSPMVDDRQLQLYMETDQGYATPKVDVRAVIFDEKNRLLFVKEKSDQHWALPGGWADIGYSPKEIAEKETWEEAGIKVQAERLIALRDKHKHPYPPSLTYTYKLFIACVFQSGELKGGLETSDAAFFSLSDIDSLSLSEERNTYEDIQMLFDDYMNPGKRTVLCD